MKKWYVFECSDGSKWRVPTERIARNRAEYYEDRFGGDVEKSLKEDTVPLFENDDFEIEDWAKNNMNWAEVENFAEKIKGGNLDMQEEWLDSENVEITD